MTWKTMASQNHGFQNTWYACLSYDWEKSAFSHEFTFFCPSNDVRKQCFYCFHFFFKIMALTESNGFDNIFLLNFLYYYYSIIYTMNSCPLTMILLSVAWATILGCDFFILFYFFISMVVGGTFVTVVLFALLTERRREDISKKTEFASWS